MDKKFIYSAEELIEYYKSKGLTGDNIDTFPNIDDSIRSLLAIRDDEKTVFYPYSGEFGTGIAKYLLRFHYTSAKYKIACISRGYECFFPDAKEFIYDYPGPKWGEYNRERWLFENTPEPVVFDPEKDDMIVDGEKRRTFRYFLWDQNCTANARKRFRNYVREKHKDAVIRNLTLLRGCKDPFTGEQIRTFAKIPFKNPNKYGIDVDVVFSNRKIETDIRSFRKWEEVIRHLQSKGLKVGGIGQKGTSFEGMNIVNNFDYDNPNEASMEMLHKAKYYIGTDTGVTHLAMNFVHLKSLLFRMKDRTNNWISIYENPNTRVIHEMCNIRSAFNDEKILCRHIDEFFV